MISKERNMLKTNFPIYFIQYNELKHMLKTTVKERSNYLNKNYDYTEDNVNIGKFFAILDNDLRLVNESYQNISESINNRINIIEFRMNEIRHENFKTIKRKYLLHKIHILQNDNKTFAKFIELNLTGFRKILKKLEKKDQSGLSIQFSPIVYSSPFANQLVIERFEQQLTDLENIISSEISGCCSCFCGISNRHSTYISNSLTSENMQVLNDVYHTTIKSSYNKIHPEKEDSGCLLTNEIRQEA